ncbi:MAG: DNA polymerase IV [Deltaproteobacteria bacterium]|nr:DNA polymerase IV [Deltaproteobacteria bacterium]
MDAFYASVEQRDRPELRGKPVIVGGLGNRGVVTAASYEARPFGVRSAMPMVEARRLCPHAVFLPGRMHRYGEASRQIFAIFTGFTPQVEPLSLDEAFLDVTGSLGLFRTPVELAARLRARVREQARLAVSVGIGPSKMVAKIASSLCKPDGLLEVPAESVADFLRPLPVGHLWGVGPVAQQNLARAGFATIGDLADADAARLRAAVGRQAPALQALARGDDDRPVDPGRERRSYGEENTFAADVRDGDELRRTIVAHAEAVAARLRADRRAARTVVLKLKLAERVAPGKYRVLTRSHSLAEPTDDGRAIAAAALALWSAVAPGKRIRLIGVAASNLGASAPAQLSLLDRPADERGRALNRALDDISARFGHGALRRGGIAVERAAPTLAIKDRPRS